MCHLGQRPFPVAPPAAAPAPPGSPLPGKGLLSRCPCFRRVPGPPGRCPYTETRYRVGWKTGVIFSAAQAVSVRKASFRGGSHRNTHASLTTVAQTPALCVHFHNLSYLRTICTAAYLIFLKPLQYIFKENFHSRKSQHHTP